MSPEAAFETLRSWVNLEEFRDSPLEAGTGLALVGFPAPEGFDAHPQFPGTFRAVFLQFQTSFSDLLPNAQGANRC